VKGNPENKRLKQHVDPFAIKAIGKTQKTLNIMRVLG